MIDEYGKAGNVDMAMSLYDRARTEKWCVGVVTISTLVKIYAASVNFDGYPYTPMGTMTNLYEEMKALGVKPNLALYNNLLDAMGRAKRAWQAREEYLQGDELSVTPDERFCSCLLNVMTQAPKEELSKLMGCIERTNAKLGRVVKILTDEDNFEGEIFKKEAGELFECIGNDSLSLGAALTALHIWVNDLSRTFEDGEELPSLLGINTGHGKHKYSEKGLAGVFESHLKELNAPFHEAPD
ncbi:Hypothetical predicted protein [Olea europaea subsp. europaea]|uniref:Smr domain-containing protein n=1 Tax=Olea europaea subsp. europaea TaxID=158383 RepID=A0A8S0RIK7_OLEEU|nr:Hypothetical predicted protein [Olea europaea subsp. europaea]